MTRARPRGFSLVEVVIAVGIFGGSIAVIFALLPTLGGRAVASTDSLVAQRLPDPLRIELRRLVDDGGFDALAARIPVATPSSSAGLAFVASRDGARLHSRDYLSPGSTEALPDEEQYFLVEIRRFSVAPLAYDPAGAVLPVMARVSWPHRVPGSTVEIASVNRTQIAFNVSILR